MTLLHDVSATPIYTCQLLSLFGTVSQENLALVRKHSLYAADVLPDWLVTGLRPPRHLTSCKWCIFVTVITLLQLGQVCFLLLGLPHLLRGRPQMRGDAHNLLCSLLP